MTGAAFVRSLLSAAALLILTGSACPGQARYAATGPGSLLTVGGTASLFEIDYGKRALGGGSIYGDINPTWRYGIEAEARILRLHQEADTHESTYLVGPRISFGKRRFNPYAKVLVGLGKFNFPYDYASGNYFVVAPGAGVDMKLDRRWRIRLVDFEYQDWPQFTYGAIHPYGVSAGISFSVFSSRSKRSD